MHFLQGLFLCVLIASSSCTLTTIRDLVQFNIAGPPVLHKTTKWNFDEGAKRSRQYQALNGYLGEKAIERLGLGVDGQGEERLEQQQARDYGHLGGVDYLTP